LKDNELLTALDKLKMTMISVSTGGSRIQEVHHEFEQTFDDVDYELDRRAIEARPPYRDLWMWYSRWSLEDLKTYQSRRVFVSQIFEPIIRAVKDRPAVSKEPSGWAKVDRQMAEAHQRLRGASNEEQFQAVGLMCREALISLAQEVFDPSRHPTDADVKVSATDFKRMIEAYIAVELRGSSADEARKHARSALDLALRLQHQRTAAFRDAAICVEATGSVVSIIAIVSGRRDPKP
jgi:hypothetical protein